jgi:hypothetical protein
MLRVIVRRGKNKPPLYFGPERKARARQRAESLAWLYGDAKIEENDETIIVEASDYYDDARKGN